MCLVLSVISAFFIPEERCLDGETYMKDLFQLNPAAEWVIKTVQR